ncbi:MAG: hypothetical protein CM15mP86_11030 [Gammaproteobacteria bacterium]|nr:MAG: hypothetical protein CM15mP86_11030 [Gammaproteobacteria bacterium]
MKVAINKIIFCIFLLQFNSQFSSEQLTAHEYVERAHNNILEIIQNKSYLFEDDPDKFKDEISEAFRPIVDFKLISRYVMGRYSKQATKEQIESFSDVFEKSLLDTYTSTLIEFKDEQINILKPDSESKHKDKAIVKIEIVTSTKVYPGRYSMYLDKESNWKIRNININGMNLAKIFRNQFYSLMEKKEEDIEKVINSWATSV